MSISGRIIARAPGINSRGQVLPALLATYRRPKPPWWEPRWADAGSCLDAAQRLRLNNYVDISGGLAVSPSPAEHLRRVRNFLAHRCEGTAIEAQAVAVALLLPNSINPLLIVETVIPPGIRILEKWATELQDMAANACS